MNQNNNENEITPNQRDHRIEELERRLEYCEQVAREYHNMYQQLQRELKTLADRQGNIQAVYDYMTKVGSTIVTKKKDRIAFLNKNNDPLRLNKKSKFNVHDTVWYADEHNAIVHQEFVKAIDWIDGNPRYCLTQIFGYIDESKLFATKEEAQWQLDEWKRS